MTYDPSKRLDTGMKAGEAVTRAAHWWDRTGRHECARIAADEEVRARSGILSGEPWELLTKDEKLKVVKDWHHYHVRRPDKLGIDPEKRIKLGHSDGTA